MKKEILSVVGYGSASDISPEAKPEEWTDLNSGLPIKVGNLSAMGGLGPPTMSLTNHQERTRVLAAIVQQQRRVSARETELDSYKKNVKDARKKMKGETELLRHMFIELGRFDKAHNIPQESGIQRDDD